VRYPNVYGIDMPAASELVAHNRSAAEVAAAIGVDRLIFQDLVDLELAVNKGNSQIKRFDTSCFSGEYITGDIDRFYLSSLERRRSDQAKHQRENARKNNNIIDLHNAS
jgi:amidophosphoribosyltransferase